MLVTEDINGMKERDEKICRKVLEWLYNGHEEHPGATFDGTEIPEDLDQYDSTDIE